MFLISMLQKWVNVCNFYYLVILNNSIFFLLFLKKKKIGIFSAIPLVGSLVIHLIVGPVFDVLRSRITFCSLTVLRKAFHIVGKQSE